MFSVGQFHKLRLLANEFGFLWGFFQQYCLQIEGLFDIQIDWYWQEAYSNVLFTLQNSEYIVLFCILYIDLLPRDGINSGWINWYVSQHLLDFLRKV